MHQNPLEDLLKKQKQKQKPESGAWFWVYDPVGLRWSMICIYIYISNSWFWSYVVKGPHFGKHRSGLIMSYMYLMTWLCLYMQNKFKEAINQIFFPSSSYSFEYKDISWLNVRIFQKNFYFALWKIYCQKQYICLF